MVICYYLSLAVFHVIYSFLKIYKKIKNQTLTKAAKLSVVQMRNNVVLSNVFRHRELKFTASWKSLGITRAPVYLLSSSTAMLYC